MKKFIWGYIVGFITCLCVSAVYDLNKHGYFSPYVVADNVTIETVDVNECRNSLCTVQYLNEDRFLTRKLVHVSNNILLVKGQRIRIENCFAWTYAEAYPLTPAEAKR